MAKAGRTLDRGRCSSRSREHGILLPSGTVNAVRVAITGASGLIGSALARSLRADGIDVLQLVRHAAADASQLSWDPAAPDAGLRPAALQGVDAVVHLSGAPIAGGRWTPARKQELRDSRVGSTAALVHALLTAGAPAPVLLVASAVGWYGDTGDHEADESAPNGSGFLPELVRDWEAAARPAADAGIRVVALRTGVVLTRRGGMIAQLLLPFRLGLGFRVGAGTQYLSWISLADHIRACRFLLADSRLSGPVNLTAPAPVTNAQFATALAGQLHRPAPLRLPAGVLRAAVGELAGELLVSCRVVPARLRDAGFTFAEPEIAAGIAAALADRTGA
jgi:uncharacterized protein